MGASQSSLTSEEVLQLQEDSHFSAAEIQQLYKRFQKLDRKQIGTISAEEFGLIPELAMNPLAARVIALFQDNTESVNFHRFVQTLSVFSPKASPEEKLKIAFRCYDVDGDGFISENDLFHVLKLLVGCNLTDAQLHVIVSKTIRECDTERQGRINFASFGKLLGDASSLCISI